MRRACRAHDNITDVIPTSPSAELSMRVRRSAQPSPTAAAGGAKAGKAPVRDMERTSTNAVIHIHCSQGSVRPPQQACAVLHIEHLAVECRCLPR